MSHRTWRNPAGADLEDSPLLANFPGAEKLSTLLEKERNDQSYSATRNTVRCNNKWPGKMDPLYNNDINIMECYGPQVLETE